MSISNSNLTEVFQLLEVNSNTIAEIEQQITDAPRMPYYKIFGSKKELEKTIEELKEIKGYALSTRVKLLEIMLDSAHKEIFFTQEEIKQPDKITI